MLKIRLSRTGKKGQPSFKILVQEHTSAVKGRKVVEEVGHYLPATNPKQFVANKERINYWIGVGAKPSPTLASLLKKDGFSDMDKYLTKPTKKSKKKKEDTSTNESAPTQEAEQKPEVAEEATTESAE